MSEAATEPKMKRDREVVVTVQLESVLWSAEREAAQRAAMEAIMSKFNQAD